MLDLPPANPQANLSQIPLSNEEITTTIVNNPPSSKSKKTKTLLTILGLLFVLASIPATIFLVKQRQEIRKMAVYPEDGFCAGAGYAEGHDSQLPYVNPSGCTDLCNDGTYNYCCWDNNGNNVFDGNDTCSPGSTGELSCSGYEICNNSGTNQTYFYVWGSEQPGKCASGGYPLPGTGANSGTLLPEKCTSIPDNKCGQLEFQKGCGVCKDTGCGITTTTPTPTPTPTLPPDTAQCDYCKAYDKDWYEITNPSTISVGQTVYFVTRGSTTHPLKITKARFRINNGTWQETANRRGNEFYISYAIPSVGSYIVESEIYNPALGWH
ncbi:MAG TPA: hypothetical protein VMX76_00300 [Nevskiaceae bacterium]|nr:hypothetical protein [Nevskiaceae bacterium]